MSTVADYRNAIKAKGYDGSSDGDLDFAIAAARRQIINERRWSYALAQNTALSTVTGTSTVSLSSITDLGEIEGVRYRSGTTEYDLDYAEPQDFRDYQAGDATTARGLPAIWTQRGATIELYPTPQAVYPLVVDYVKTAADLGASSATVDALIPDRDRELVAWKATEILAYRQRDQFQTVAREEYRAELRKAKGRDNVTNRQDSDQVKPFWGRPRYAR